MFLIEPNHTPYDLHFRVFDVPVRVHPLFWLVAFIMGFSPRDPKTVFLWMIAVFISILIHEMGHALVIRWFGWSPSVVLYSLGGLAIHNPYLDNHYSPGRARRNRWTQILISLAGPFAGFLFAALIYLSAYGTGAVSFRLTWLQETIPIILPAFEPGDNRYVLIFLIDLIYINIFWGLVNLLPIWPLDGGKVARELFLMFDRSVPVRNALILSMICAGGVAYWGLKNGSGFLGMMFILMAVGNYQEMSGTNRYGGGNPW